LNLGWGYIAPRSTQPSIPSGSVNEYQLRLGRQRQVWLIPLADEMQGVQVKLCYPLTTRAIPERLRDISHTNRHYLLPLKCLFCLYRWLGMRWHGHRFMAMTYSALL